MLAILLSSPVVSVVGTLTAAKSHLPLKDCVGTLQASMLQEGLKHVSSGQSIREKDECVVLQHRVCYTWVSIDPTLSPHCVEHPEDVADHEDTRKRAGWEVCQIGFKDHTAPYPKSESLTLNSISWLLSKQGAKSAPQLPALSCLRDVLSWSGHQDYGGIFSDGITLAYVTYW